MWQKKDDYLYKKFEFKDFSEAFGFISQVAGLAEQQNHHPKILSDYNAVEVWLTTHSKNAVTEKDESLAAAIDKLSSPPEDSGERAQLTEAKLFTDGGSRGNPGPSALGYVIYNFEDEVIKKDSKYLGVITNNQAEYLGLKVGLEACLELGVVTLEVYMDSLLVINQVKGLFKVKNADLMPINAEVRALAGKFETISFTHVPRAMNKLADTMVNECLDAQ